MARKFERQIANGGKGVAKVSNTLQTESSKETFFLAALTNWNQE